MRDKSWTVKRICAVLEVSRAGYYRQRRTIAHRQRDAEVREQIQQIALEMSFYGYRRIHAELRGRGLVVNHKRVLRLMREDNLLCLRRKSFYSTTQSQHSYAIYPNLVPQLNVSTINQLWVADITYVRLREEFVFLAVLLDAYSRRCIGWALKRSLHAALTLEALGMALRQRRIQPGIVHHSDRGVQYACRDYVTLLEQHGFRISMSRVGNPYDNAQAESFIKTLKYEEVYRCEYRDWHEAHAHIGEFIEAVYNTKRLHSALGYRTPVEFELSCR